MIFFKWQNALCCETERLLLYQTGKTHALRRFMHDVLAESRGNKGVVGNGKLHDLLTKKMLFCFEKERLFY